MTLYFMPLRPPRFQNTPRVQKPPLVQPEALGVVPNAPIGFGFHAVKFGGFAITNRSIFNMLQSRLYPQSWLDPGLLKDKRVLDVGCGGGAFVRDLRVAGVDAHGVDCDPKFKEKQPEHCFYEDAAEMHFPDNSFDVVYSTWSLFSYPTTQNEAHSRAKQIAVLREIHRVLKPGGVVRIAPLSLMFGQKSRELVSMLEEMGGNRLVVTQAPVGRDYQPPPATEGGGKSPLGAPGLFPEEVFCLELQKVSVPEN